MGWSLKKGSPDKPDTMVDPDSSTPPEARARVLTTLALLPGLALLWHGGWVAAMLVLLVGAVMLAEAIAIAGVSRSSWRGSVIVLLGLAPAFLMLIEPLWTVAPGEPAAFGLYWLLSGLAIVGYAALGGSLVMTALLGAITLTLVGGVGLAVQGGEVPWLLVVAVTVAAADIAAYFGGRTIGGPKLAPSISPAKTWSGAIAGLAAGCVAATVLGVVFSVPLLVMAVAGFVIADCAIGGDLLESIYKRRHGVKDAGSILPGHGGLLDRFDGYLLALPASHLAVSLGWLNGGLNG